MDVLTNLRDDSLKRMVDAVSELIATAEKIKHEEENIRRFSDQMISVKELLVKLQSQQPGGQFSRGSAGNLLGRMEDAVNTARETIEWYHSKGSFVRFVFCSSVFSRLTQCSKQIADTLRLLPITQVSSALDAKGKLDAIIHSLDSMVFKLEANTEAIHSRLDMYVAEKNGIRQPVVQKLADNPRPEGGIGSSRVSPLPLPIEFPEVQVGEPNKDAYRLNQNLHLYSVDEIVNLSSFCFSCPLTWKIMEDPVCVSCNHSYERKAIEDYFCRGGELCLVCKKELSSTEGKLDLKPNSALQGIISEWKQNNTNIEALKNAKKKLRDATARLINNSPDNVESTNGALEDLQSVMMDVPSCISEATESSCKLVPKLAVLLKNSAGVNTRAVLQCLLLIARFSDKNKEIIGKGGVIKCLLKQGSMNEAAAVEILLELSKDDRVAHKIIEINTSIATLVSLLGNPEPQLAENAGAVLKNLSNTNINSTIIMAESGYLAPFLDQFNSEGNFEETRALMAGKLAQMHLTETAASSFENEQFIIHLCVMLSSSLPDSKLASLSCIKRLMAFDRLRRWILSNGYAIPAALLCLISDTSIEQQWKQDSLEILISLIELSQPSEQQTNPCLERLYSHNSIHDLIEQIKISTTHEADRVLLLQLLLAMVKKSGTARDCIISDQNTVSCLYSALAENSEVRLHALKLIHHIAASNPVVDAPLPSHPAKKEAALRSITAILTESRVEEEISMVAGIISHLPRGGDRDLNAMLQSPDVLKALHLQISGCANNSNELVENALGALMRCIDQLTSGVQMQLVGNLEQAIVQILTTGSPLSKQRAAAILARLTRSTQELLTSPSSSSHFRRNSWPFQSSSTKCALHESSCSAQRVMCLVRTGAVRPLICMIEAMNPAASEAALMALLNLFEPGASETVCNAASSIIVGNKGAPPILEVLERGPLPRVKKAAFELFGKIYRHPGITREQSEKFKAILPHLLNEETVVRKKVTTLITELF